MFEAELQNQKMHSRLIAAALFVAVFLAGFFTGKVLGTDNGTQNYKEELKTRLTGTGMFMPEKTEVMLLSGSIKSIQGETLLVSLSYPKDLFSDFSLDERMVTIDAGTKIVRIVAKDATLFQKELEEYQKRRSESGPEDSVKLTPPQMFEKRATNHSFLKVGQSINITTLENVKDKKNFIAATIEIWESSSVAQPDL